MIRSIVATIALLAVCLTAAVATVGWWTRATVTDPDRFVETLAPLATEPEVTALAERRLVKRVVAQIDKVNPIDRAADTLRSNGMVVEAAMLPILAEPLRQETVETVKRVAHRVVTGPEFADAWEASLKEVHPQLIAVLEDQPNDVVDTTENGILTLRLGTLTKAVASSLKKQEIPGTERLAAVDIAVPVTDVENLEKAQTGYSLLNNGGRWLPVVVGVLLVLGLVLAHRRFRAAGLTALVVALTLVALLVGIGIGRRYGVDALPGDARDAGDTMIGVLTSPLHTLIWTLLIGSAVVAVGALGLSVVRRLRRHPEPAAAPAPVDGAPTT